MPVSTIISHLNKLCGQKPGGYFEMPKLSDSKYCALCNHGCHCFGPSCKGPKPPTDHTVRSLEIHPTSSMISGLQEESSPSSTSPLTKRERTRSKKIYISGSHYRPDSSILNWQGGRQHTSPVSTSREGTENKSTFRNQQQKREQKPWYETLNNCARKQVLSFLLKSSLNTIQTT